MLQILGSAVVLLLLASSSAHLGLFAGAMALGLVIGVYGHVIKSRTLIVTGILIIGLLSVYFSFVLQPH
jgi:hypothetical protein